jgi:predicted CoA-substrate-specific enzyme activase
MPELAVGIDIGSTTGKGVLVDADGAILASFLRTTGVSVADTAVEVLTRLEKQHGASLDGVPVISTGYGRASVNFATDSITELTCHCVGIHRLNPEIKLIVDVGGQDSKVIRIGKNGRPADFELNDKCSAGTGRFLEVMARVLEVQIEELGPLALESDSPCPISSTCTVFAESEVVGRIGAGDSPIDIAAGIHQSMAAKIGTLAKRVGVVEPICVTGGVALNPGFRHYLSLTLKSDLWMPDSPQLTGAYGAAILALNH